MRSLARVSMVAAVAYGLGWALVLLSGHGGNSVGGSEIVWRIGGIMVYAAMAAAALIAVGVLGWAVVTGARRACHAPRG